MSIKFSKSPLVNYAIQESNDNFPRGNFTQPPTIIGFLHKNSLFYWSETERMACKGEKGDEEWKLTMLWLTPTTCRFYFIGMQFHPMRNLILAFNKRRSCLPLHCHHATHGWKIQYELFTRPRFCCRTSSTCIRSFMHRRFFLHHFLGL